MSSARVKAAVLAAVVAGLTAGGIAISGDDGDSTAPEPTSAVTSEMERV